MDSTDCIILNFCGDCDFHDEGKCTKENLYCIYTKCVQRKAVQEFIANNKKNNLGAQKPPLFSRVVLYLHQWISYRLAKLLGKE